MITQGTLVGLVLAEEWVAWWRVFFAYILFPQLYSFWLALIIHYE